MEAVKEKVQLQKYPAHKDSGVEWLGEIPEHWEIQKMKFIGEVYAGITDKKGDDFSKQHKNGFKPFIPFTNICNNFYINEDHYQFVNIDDKENQKLVKSGDLLFLMSSETPEDIGLCSLFKNEKNKNVFLNSFCKGFRLNINSTVPSYLNYLMLSKPYRGYFALMGKGFTRINLKQEFIKNAPALLPPKEEQTTIANFLDEKCGKIDTAIAQKQQLIELLKERKQIIIQKAVTKGLDPDVKMKDSGVKWIGEIPEHWEILSNKNIFRLKKNLVGKKSDQYELLSLTLKGIIKRDMVNPEGKFPAEFGTYQEVKKGDFVFCLFDVEETPRTVGLSPYAGMITGAYTVMRSKNEFNKSFLYFFYLYLDNEKRLKPLYKGLRNTIPKDSFFSFKTFIPPFLEQQKIVDFIKIQSNRTDEAISHQEKQIEKLKEYKSSLIDAAVTGKIKVTNS